MMQPDTAIEQLEQLTVEKTEAIRELLDLCGAFSERIEKEKTKVLSLVLPVAILLSFGRKSKPQENPHDILRHYRFNNANDEENIILLSKAYDLYEYTENIKAMIVEGSISIGDLGKYEELLYNSLQEKEKLMEEISFASPAEIDEAFDNLLGVGEEAR